MSPQQMQQELFALAPEELAQNIRVHILDLLKHYVQPGPEELIEQLQMRFGWPVRQVLMEVVRAMRDEPDCKGALRDYLHLTLSDTNLQEALLNGVRPDAEFKSTVDELFRRSVSYGNSQAFKKAIEFIARFRDYAPFNNMLIQLQRPGCSFYATARDWQERFNRTPTDDANPLLILAPMHPVMLVYDLDDTDGEKLPEKFLKFSQASGALEDTVWTFTLKNAARDGIAIRTKKLASTLGGYAQPIPHHLVKRFKMQIVVREELDLPSRYAVLCHELGHIYLGHLGGDGDNWWPSRRELTHAVVEIEAEAVAFIVAKRMGIKTSSDEYLGSYLTKTEIPAGVSMELIAKVAGRIETMAKKELPPRKRINNHAPPAVASRQTRIASGRGGY